ncbi:DEAD/DEAH box helicase family protein [Candidatus Bathyarchaeota archaeon]|nr:DEAD/DEAH box helicase family protein [Candidatus Bathyarchaeota archaeon]MBS7630648.1 DEAD/DEAH box helicase family protein [Candidatus Bathyarchaeota archaeon]
MIELSFIDGSIIAKGGVIIYGKYDYHLGAFRAPAFRYREVIKDLKEREVNYVDKISKVSEFHKRISELELWDYQKEALEAWKNADRRGVVVLPTGAGKTMIALKAIEDAGTSTLVIVPTLVLVEQWKEKLEKTFGERVGIVGGGKDIVEALTVTTYDSASLRARELGNKFNLLIFDEVHHLPAPTFKKIGEEYIALYRLGLSATVKREDGFHLLLPELVGEKVYEMRVEDLAGTHLADYTIETIHVPLKRVEREEYEMHYNVYQRFIRERGIKMKSARDFQRLIMRSGFDPEARRALLSRNRAMEIALNSEAKISYLKNLILENSEEKTIIFTQYNSMVYRISREMLIPAITHQTPREEREDILRKFSSGEYRRIVTSKVLEEGVDVPDASLAVILSGTGSSRSFIQRLGRVLRKKEKKAKLIELVSVGTVETRLSKRRKQD